MARHPLSFAERNKVVIAVVGLLALAAVFFATFNAASLPIIGGGETHTAYFREAGGLREGNEVRVSGVKVGEVTKLSLEGNKVKVTFRVKGVDLGDQTSAGISVKTLLGRKFLDISPAGGGDLDAAIPLERTTTPYDVNAAFSDVSSEIDQIDTAQLEKSLEVLSTAFENTPPAVRELVSGLSALSRTISTRDDDLSALLKSTTSVTGTLAERNAEFAKILSDGNDLMGELENRRDAVQAMLKGTANLGVQVRGLVADNQKTLAPALAKLDRVSAILQRNEANLNSALKKLGPYYRVLTATTANGHWLESYICGLFDGQGAPLLENDVLRNCTPKKGGGR
ncbi:MCE family protein [Nocardioides sp. Bht2]|uniref:MCE family protein n=1 Tax=Nocardioides sp. Bht2 TaxID=3392297 RepID=UPI0039B3D482